MLNTGVASHVLKNYYIDYGLKYYLILVTLFRALSTTPSQVIKINWI